MPSTPISSLTTYAARQFVDIEHASLVCEIAGDPAGRDKRPRDLASAAFPRVAATTRLARNPRARRRQTCTLICLRRIGGRKSAIESAAVPLQKGRSGRAVTYSESSTDLLTHIGLDLFIHRNRCSDRERMSFEKPSREARRTPGRGTGHRFGARRRDRDRDLKSLSRSGWLRHDPGRGL